MSLFHPTSATIDLETTMYGDKDNLADPVNPANRIVMYGVKLPEFNQGWVSSKDYPSDARTFQRDLRGRTLYIGHNIKFDLLYLLHRNIIKPADLYNKKIWDTQLAEYLLTGQQAVMISLDDLVTKYGGTLKASPVTEFFKAGKGADFVPEAMLKEYLGEDLLNTESVAFKQMKIAEDSSMMPLLESQMEALKGTIYMEYNGMMMDVLYMKEMANHLGVLIKDVGTRLTNSVTALRKDIKDFNWGSNNDVSLLLFGGDRKEVVRELVGTYKNGNDKYRNITKVTHIIGIAKREPPEFGSEKTINGHWTVDEKVLKNISLNDIHPSARCLSKDIMYLRELSKQKETYYENLLKLTRYNGFLYPSLNHTITKTGRLSCSKPNIQNQTTDGGIKKAYVSRWGEDGMLVEFDYSQLEMVALAFVSGDVQLTQDINDGVDLHTALFEEMYGRTPTSDERKKFKRLSFGLVYGAGALTLSENAECSLADAKKFIKVFYARYPMVKTWHDNMIGNAKMDRVATTKFDKDSGMPVGEYIHRSVTGRKYVFREYYTEWKKAMSFSPTELKNYLVQGFATGDVVPYIVGLLCNASLLHSDKFVPIMTVHDSILFDVKKVYLDEFVEKCYTVLNATTELVNTKFSIRLPIRLSVNCSVGSNWQDMIERKCT